MSLGVTCGDRLSCGDASVRTCERGPGGGRQVTRAVTPKPQDPAAQSECAVPCEAPQPAFLPTPGWALTLPKRRSSQSDFSLVRRLGLLREGVAKGNKKHPAPGGVASREGQQNLKRFVLMSMHPSKRLLDSHRQCARLASSGRRDEERFS